jgi:DnaK suppressor protein
MATAMPKSFKSPKSTSLHPNHGAPLERHQTNATPESPIREPGQSPYCGKLYPGCHGASCRGSPTGRPRPVGLLSSDVLTPEQREHFRERLEAEKARLEAAIATADAELKRPIREEAGAADAGDEAANVFDREEAIAQIEVDREILGRIERALQRLDDGTYGTSQVSGKPIPVERLEVVPWATTLVDEEPPE